MECSRRGVAAGRVRPQLGHRPAPDGPVLAPLSRSRRATTATSPRSASRSPPAATGSCAGRGGGGARRGAARRSARLPGAGAERWRRASRPAGAGRSRPASPACAWRRGYAVPPAAATRAFAARARRRPARACRRGEPRRRGGRRRARDVVVVVAAGAWTPAIVDPTGAWRPIEPLWGVNAEVRLPAPPRHAVEEAGIEELAGAGATRRRSSPSSPRHGVSSLGSTFLPERAGPGGGGAARCTSAARASCRRWRRRDRVASAPARGRCRPTAGRCSAAPGLASDVLVAAGHGAVGHLARAGLGAAGGRPRARAAGRRSAPALDPARFG